MAKDLEGLPLQKLKMAPPDPPKAHWLTLTCTLKLQTGNIRGSTLLLSAKQKEANAKMRSAEPSTQTTLHTLHHKGQRESAQPWACAGVLMRLTWASFLASTPPTDTTPATTDDFHICALSAAPVLPGHRCLNTSKTRPTLYCPFPLWCTVFHYPSPASRTKAVVAACEVRYNAC